MIYLKNPLCLGMEESEYKEMLALGGMRQKHFEKMKWFCLPDAPRTRSGWCCPEALILKISTCGAAKAFWATSVPDRFSGKLMHFPAKHWWSMRLLPTRPIFYSGIWIFSSTRRIPQAPGSQNLSGICYRSPCAKSRALPADFLYNPENDPRAAACLSVKPGGKSRQQLF